MVKKHRALIDAVAVMMLRVDDGVDVFIVVLTDDVIVIDPCQMGRWVKFIRHIVDLANAVHVFDVGIS